MFRNVRKEVVIRRQTTHWPQRTNNDIQSSTQKTKDRTTRSPLKTRGNERKVSSVSVLVFLYKSCMHYAT